MCAGGYGLYMCNKTLQGIQMYKDSKTRGRLEKERRESTFPLKFQENITGVLFCFSIILDLELHLMYNT